MDMRLWRKVGLGMLMAACVPVVARAQATATDGGTAPGADAKQGVTPPTIDAPATPKSKITGTVSANVVSAYISRGIILENEGLIGQPSAQLNLGLYEGDGIINSITPYVGIWNSIHSNHEFATSSNARGWYEFDWYVGINTTVAKNWNFDFQYVEFISPSDAFSTARNFQLKTSYNDSDLLGTWALKPYVTLLLETDAKAGTGSDQGLYIEVGIGPGFTVNENSDMPVTFTFPIFTGLGAEDFYGDQSGNDEWFGYLAGGVVVSVPMKFMPQGYGSWVFSVGGYYYQMGPGVRSANNVAATDEPNQFLGVAGISVNF